MQPVHGQDLIHAHKGSLKYNYYKLTREQAETIYKKGPQGGLDKYMTDLVLEVPNDSFSTVKPKEPGHYMYTYVLNNIIYYNSYSKPFLRVNMRGALGEGRLKLYDFDGNAVVGATVRYEEKEDKWLDVPFDVGCGCYGFRDEFYNKLMSIEHNGQFDYYYISNEGLRIPSIDRSNPYAGQRAFPGYMVFNKPKYRHFDTLKMKAFVVTNEGRPLRRKLDVYINANYKEVKIATIKPVSAGAYVYEFVVGDSIRLNSSITLKLKSKSQEIKSNSVFVEDYELKKASYSSRMLKSSFNRGEKVEVVIDAFDANSMPMLDTRVKLNVRFSSATAVVPEKYQNNDSFFTKIFSYNDLIDETGTSIIEIPDSVLPPLVANYAVDVELINSEGEYKRFSHNFNYNAKPTYHKIRQVGNKLLGVKYVNGKLQKGDAVTIYQYGYDGNTVITTQTNFPIELEINPSAQMINVLEGDSNIFSQYVYDYANAATLVTGTRTHDSVFVSLQNDFDLDVYYRVYRNKQVVAKGFGKSIDFKDKDNSMWPYYVLWGYQWAGKEHFYETPLTVKEKELKVKIHQTKAIFPGEKVNVKISVTDYKNQPLKKVNLTAYAVNMEFPNIPVPEMPYFGRRFPNMSRNSNFTSRQVSFSGNQNLVDTYYDKYKVLDTNYYLHYQHPKEYVREYQQPIEYEKSEFVPMVFYDGSEQPIVNVWIDDHLISSRINENLNHNIYRYPAGTYTIKLRLHRHIYTIKNVNLEPYKRLYLSIDFLKCKSGRVSQQELTDFMLTEEEYGDILEQTMFLDYTYFNSDTVWIENNGMKWLLRTNAGGYYKTHYYRELNKTLTTITGLKAGQTVMRFNRDTIYFNFEPGNYYVLENGILSSYPLPNLPLNHELFDGRRYRFNDNLAGIPLYFKNETRKIIEKKQKAAIEKEMEKPWHEHLRAYSYYRGHKSKWARFQMFNPTGIDVKCFWLVNEDHPNFSMAYNGNSSNYQNNFKKGNYTLVVITNRGKVYIQKDINLGVGDYYFTRLQSNRFVKGNAEMVEPYREIIHRVSRPEINSAPLFPELLSGNWEFKPDTSNLGSILGRLKDQTSLYDIANATIFLEQNGYVKNAVITNAWGEFIFRNVQDGEYMVKIMCNGYRYTTVHKLRVFGGKTTVMDLNLERTKDYVASVNKPIQKAEELVNHKVEFGSGQVNVKISDGVTGEILIAVNVSIWYDNKLVKGAVTNFEGIAAFNNLPEKEYELRLDYVGYESRKIKIDLIKEPKYSFYLALFPNANELNEVMIVRNKMVFGTMDESGGSGGYYNYSTEEIRSLPVRGVTGVVATAAGATSVDGSAPVIRGGRSDEVITYIDGMPVRGSGAMALSAYPDGVGTDVRFKADFAFGDLDARDLRNDNILTDALSILGNKTPPNRLRTDFRDYAYWEPNLITDDEGNSYFTAKFPDNITQWQTIVPAMDHRRNTGLATTETKAFLPYTAQLGLPRFLVKGDTVEISGKVFNYTEDTLEANARFEQDGKELFSTNTSISRRESFTTTITGVNKDSVDISFILSNNNGFKEGEKRPLRIFDDFIGKGRVKTISVSSDTSFTISQELNEEFGVIVFNNNRDFLIEQIKRLKHYNYGCVEQTASKLYALLAEKQLCQVMGRPFNDEKMLKRMMARLAKFQKINGSWGWWQHDKSNDWISLYVVKVLAKAQGLGYNSFALTRGLNYIKRNQDKFTQRLYLESLTVLKPMGLRVELGRFQNLDYKKLNELEKLLYLRVQQLLGEKDLSIKVAVLMHKDACGRVYWGNRSRYFYSGKSFATMIALEILANENAKPRLVKAIEKSLFEKSCYYSSMNTLERALLIGYLLDNMETDTDNDVKKGFFINDQKVIDYPKRLDQTEGEIKVKYVGEMDALIMIVRNDKVRNASADSAFFNTKTTFYQDGKKVNYLKLGIDVQMEVNIKNRLTADYVMIEIPIPAGCSYGTTELPKFEREVYREYRRDKVIIYCTELMAGEHQFRISLEPRFKGSFNVLPTKAEEMYSPQNSGNNAVKVVKIVE